MTNATPPAAFNCPQCGAPLEVKKGVRSMTCPFCSATVIIPKDLRSRHKQAAGAGATPTSSHGLRNGCLVAFGIVALVGILLVAGLAVWTYSFGTNLVKSNPALGTAAAEVTSGFAKKVLIFGSKGTTPGAFTDARSVAVSANGNILVGDYQDGRVQTFDPSGKYLSGFSVGNGASVEALLAGPDGKI